MKNQAKQNPSSDDLYKALLKAAITTSNMLEHDYTDALMECQGNLFELQFLFLTIQREIIKSLTSELDEASKQMTKVVKDMCRMDSEIKRLTE